MLQHPSRPAIPVLQSDDWQIQPFKRHDIGTTKMALRCLVLDPKEEGCQLFAAGDRGFIYRFTIPVDQGETIPVECRNVGSTVYSLAMVPRTLILGLGGFIQLREKHDLSLLCALYVSQVVRIYTLLPIGDELLSGGWDGQVRVHSLRALPPQLVRVLDAGHRSSVVALVSARTAVGGTVVCAGGGNRIWDARDEEDSRIIISDLCSGQPLAIVDAHATCIRAMCTSTLDGGGIRLMSTGYDGLVCAHVVDRGEERTSARLVHKQRASDSWIHTMACTNTPDAVYIGAEDGWVSALDPVDLSTTAQALVSNAFVLAMAASPCGTRLFVADYDGDVFAVELRPPLWTRTTHRLFPRTFRRAVFSLLLLFKRNGPPFDVLPDDVNTRAGLVDTMCLHLAASLLPSS